MDTPNSAERRPATPSSILPPAFQRGNAAPASPIHFATSSNAFGLASSSSSSAASVSPLSHAGISSSVLAPSPTATSPPSAGTVQTRRLRRPSLLSLASGAAAVDHRKGAVATDASTSPTSLLAAVSERDAQLGSEGPDSGPSTLQPLPRWASGSAFQSLSTPDRVNSAPPIPFEGLTTSSTSPAPGVAMGADARTRWLPPHLQARRSSGSAIDADAEEGSGSDSPRPFNSRVQGRPLPGPLLATLISESSPLEHEMRSEARLQRLLTSHPSALPLTPRQRRSMRLSRGRFPEMVGDDDDDDEDACRLRLGARWRAGSSDSDSDDAMEEDWSIMPAHGAGAVNSAFASVMDLDRPASSGSSALRGSDSGKSTPGGQRKGRVAPSPGTSLILPNAFGSLAMGNNNGGASTPIGSPTTDKGEMLASPTASAVASPGMMQYRDPPPSIRAGKRKAAAEERFDPYKRPRGSSPSPFQNAALSPSKPVAIPIPSSPSHIPALPSSLALSSPGYLNLGQARPTKTAHHPYTRPMSSRSRAASPALSIGSTSGVLSTSMGNNGFTKDGKSLTGPFIPSGPGSKEAVSAANEQGAAPGSLGSLGLLSLQQRQDEENRMEED